MMASPPDWTALASSKVRREEILVTVKAYPNPSRRYTETVCVAGITRSGKWIRLYPIPYRFLQYEQRFPTYGWIAADIWKSNDHRPESYKVDLDTLTTVDHLGTEDHWRDRCNLILPLASPSLEYLRERQQTDGTSLGLIRPKSIKRLIIQRENSTWSAAELAKLRQRTLPDGKHQSVRELEKIPYSFKYEFVCDDDRCTGHKLSVISWEMMQSYRDWQARYEADWEQKFRQKYEDELPGPARDLHFYVGTVSKYPHIWTIIGLFYPPTHRSPSKQPAAIQQSLF